MSSLKGSSSCDHDDNVTVWHSMSKNLGEARSTQHNKFLDMPLEVRNMIYKYIFEGAILRIDMNGVDIENSRAHCAILGTCHAVNGEATPILFEQAWQEFGSYNRRDNLYRGKKNLNLKALHPSLVPRLRVLSYHPHNNFRLDMKVLTSYSRLRELELGVFASLWSFVVPYPVWMDDSYTTLNVANDAFLVAELKKTLLTNTYQEIIPTLFYRPLSLQAFKGILNSQNRKFSLLLRCRTQIRHEHDQPDCESTMVALLDWDNHKILEKEELA